MLTQLVGGAKTRSISPPAILMPLTFMDPPELSRVLDGICSKLYTCGPGNLELAVGASTTQYLLALPLRPLSVGAF